MVRSKAEAQGLQIKVLDSEAPVPVDSAATQPSRTREQYRGQTLCKRVKLFPKKGQMITR